MDTKRLSLTLGLVVVLPFLVLGGFWLFSVNRYKAPPARVVSVPSGFEVVGEDTDGGSGGTTIRWVILKVPEGMSVEDAMTELQDSMSADGWESASVAPDRFIWDGTFGLMKRGDEWAAFESSRSVSAWTRETLDLDEIDPTGTTVIVVRLQYSNWGQGRRVLFG